MKMRPHRLLLICLIALSLTPRCVAERKSAPQKDIFEEAFKENDKVEFHVHSSWVSYFTDSLFLKDEETISPEYESYYDAYFRPEPLYVTEFLNKMNKIKTVRNTLPLQIVTQEELPTFRLHYQSIFSALHRLVFRARNIGSSTVRCFALPELMTLVIQLATGSPVISMFTVFALNGLFRIFMSSAISPALWFIVMIMKLFTVGTIMFKEKMNRMSISMLFVIRLFFFAAVMHIAETEFNTVSMITIVGTQFYLITLVQENIRDQVCRSISTVSIFLETFTILGSISDVSVQTKDFAWSTIIKDNVGITTLFLRMFFTMDFSKLNYIDGCLARMTYKIVIMSYATDNDDITSATHDLFKDSLHETFGMFVLCHFIVSIFLTFIIMSALGYYYAHYLRLRRKTNQNEDAILFDYFLFHVGLGFLSLSPSFMTFHIDDPGTYNWIFSILSILKLATFLNCPLVSAVFVMLALFGKALCK